jgi:hypothetical protein
VTFRSSTDYSWAGQSGPRLPRSLLERLSALEARNSLLYRLQAQLYQSFYCRGGLISSAADTAGHAVHAHSFEFVQQLSAANVGSGFWDAGWEVRALMDKGVMLVRNGLLLSLVDRTQVLESAAALVLGSSVHLRLPKQFPNLMPGFYIASSNQRLVETTGFVRFYWNLTPAGAIQLVKRVTTQLNGAGLSFKCKVLTDPGAYSRCDAGVLYVRQEDCHPVIELLEGIYPEIRPNLKPLTPVFTKRLSDGLGLAEEPGQQESLGQQRCGILAEGMLRAYELGKRAVEDRLQVVEDCFSEAGLRLDEPFLNPGSQDRYAFQVGRGGGETPDFSSKSLFRSAPVDDFLQTAVQIGQRLSESAVWHQEICAWLGPRLVGDERMRGRPAYAYRALGPDIYEGTSGVAWFLGELYSYTRDEQVRKTASGAILHALATANDVPPAVRAGLYSGWTGIALAAARLSRSLERPELGEMARRLLHEKILALDNLESFDILSGKAGAIVACLILHEMLGSAEALGFAVRMGDELIDRAVPSAKGLSWRTPGIRHIRNLTGFSHGNAGAAYALLELSSVTGEAKYSQTVQNAFEYERGWFNRDAANWPDFRERPVLGPRGEKVYSYSTAWCHGAPGIAISRLRAYELFGDESCRDEAEIALQTTRRAIEASLKTGTGNYSLCHGLSGNSEVLLYGARVLAVDGADWRESAFRTGIFGNNHYARPDREWPCGAACGQVPGLMTGLAGIGYFYLHLSGASAPFVLAPRREAFTYTGRGSTASSTSEVLPQCCS